MNDWNHDHENFIHETLRPVKDWDQLNFTLLICMIFTAKWMVMKYWGSYPKFFTFWCGSWHQYYPAHQTTADTLPFSWRQYSQHGPVRWWTSQPWMSYTTTVIDFFFLWFITFLLFATFEWPIIWAKFHKTATTTFCLAPFFEKPEGWSKLANDRSLDITKQVLLTIELVKPSCFNTLPSTVYLLHY